MKKILLLIVLVSFGVKDQLLAQVYHFTFRVPVELHLIPADIKSFGVNVTVYDKPFNQGYPIPGSRIGAESIHLPIVNGEYNDTVTVAFNEDLRKDPSKAVAWDAILTLFGPPGYQGGVMIAMGPDTPYPYDPSRPLVYQLIGSVSPQPLPAIKKIEPVRKFEKRF